MAAEPEPSSHVYVSLQQLMKLEHHRAAFSLLPRQPAHSVLAGSHGSKLRGRGLNFLELRAYAPGDDIRSIDWKVTARARKPYSRIFTEERERPVMMLVDQRQSMFFGSRLNMKSVTAAEIAALAAWRVLRAKDRIGAIVFGNNDVQVIRPQSDRATVIRILKVIVNCNRRLTWQSSAVDSTATLNKALQQMQRLVTHDSLLLQITDGAGRDAETQRHNTNLAAHNDLVLAYVFDPMELTLPAGKRLVVSDGSRQMALPADAVIQRRFREDHATHVSEVQQFWSARQTPVLPVSAGEPTAPQLRRLLSVGRPSRGVR